MKVHPTQNKKQQKDLTPLQTLAVSFALTAALFAIPEAAFAASNPIQAFLDGAISFLNSGVMRSLAILALFAVGIAAYRGKLSSEWAVRIGGGIIFTFGAASLADLFISWAS